MILRYDKGLHDSSSKGINDMFAAPMPRENNTTRAVDNVVLLIPRSRNKAAEGNVRVRGSRYFNTLSTDTKLKPSFESFKEAVKKEKGIIRNNKYAD